MISNKYISKIFELVSSPILILLPDAPKFTIVDVNNAHLKITGTVHDQLIGESFSKALPCNFYSNATDLKNSLQAVITYKTESRTKHEFSISQARVNTVKYFEVVNTPVLNEKNDLEYIIVAVTDVTEIINAQQAESLAKTRLEHNENFLTETELTAKSGSWEVDTENRVIKSSAMMRKIFEVDDDYQMDFDSSLLFFKEGEDRDIILKAVTDAIEKCVVFDVEVPIATAKRNQRWVRVTGKSEKVGEICHRVYGTIQDITARKISEQDLMESRNRFQTLIQTVQGIVWEADANTFEFTFISDKVKSILGYSPDEWLHDPCFWQNHIHPDDREHAINYCHIQTQKCRNHTFDYRMFKRDGSLIWIKDVVCVITENEMPKWLRGIMVDITEAKHLAVLDLLANTVLELNAKKDAPIQDVLAVYLNGIEALFPQMKCSILQVKNGRLYKWAAPSLPKDYVDAIQNLPIGENVGSCGTAAYLKEKVIVSNIANDYRWTDYKQFALPHNLHACWSYPIIDSGGTVMAVFAMYYHEERLPGTEELEIIERSADVIKIVLENWQNLTIIQENVLLMNRGEELANFGTWQWDIQNNVVNWSDGLYKIYGIGKQAFKATFEGYLELLHPDDKESVYNQLQELIISKKDILFEERIIRPGGEIRYLKSWAAVQTGENGVPTKMIGACIDITYNKIAEIKLDEMHRKLEIQLKGLEISEKRYSDLFHLSPLSMWVYDIDSLKFLSVNNSAITHYGYSREEFLNMSVTEIMPQEESIKLEEAITQLRQEDGLNYSGIFKHQKKNGDVIQVFIQSNFIRFNEGNTHLELATDITERQNYIDEIESQNKQLHEIAWVQSHIVRAPLARIMGLIELFNGNMTTMADKHEITAYILTSAYELDNIIKDMSDKIYSGSPVITSGKVEIGK